MPSDPLPADVRVLVNHWRKVMLDAFMANDMETYAEAAERLRTLSRIKPKRSEKKDGRSQTRRFSDKEVLKIRRAYAAGESIANIARRRKCAHSTLYNVLKHYYRDIA